MALLKHQLDPRMVHRLLTDTATFGTVLQVICLIQYGEDIFAADPLDLYARLQDDFGAEMPEDNENKLNAIMMATSTDLFYEDAEAFRGICNSLSEGDPGFLDLDPLTLPEVFWGMFEVELHREPKEVSPAIHRLIQQAMVHEGHDPEEDPMTVIDGYLQERHCSLQRQLYDLGVSDTALPPIQSPGAVKHDLPA
jgi:hypothetical protein